MYTLRLLNRIKPVQRVRLISNYPTLRDSKPTTNAVPNIEEAKTSSSSNPSVMGRRMVTPRDFDKKILVWMKYYKSVDEIPNQISYESLDKAQNWFRIRCANIMIAATLLGVLGAAWYGKKRAARGESVEQMNIDWHNKITSDYKSNVATAAAEKKE